MSFTDNYLKLRKERLGVGNKNNTSFDEKFANIKAQYFDEEEDIAPVRELTNDDAKKAVKKMMGKEEEEADEDDRKWFQKGAFEDGYQFGDIAKTIFGSDSDLANNVTAGILGIGEKVVDTGATIVGGVAGLFGNDNVKDKMADFAEKDLYDEHKVAEKMNSMQPNAIIRKLLGVDAEEDSVFGEKTDDLAYSGGQLVGTVGLQSVGVPWYVTTGATSFGGAMESALKEGATFEEAAASSAISAGAEILSEKLFGGSGLGEKGLINLGGLTKGISNKLVKALADYGVDVAAEGFEEIFSQFAGNFASSLYKEDDLEDLLFSEEAIDGYIESFIGGGVLGGGMNVGNVASSIQSGKDYRSGLTANEEAVVNKVYDDRIAEAKENGETLTAKDKDKIYNEVLSDLENGYISTDNIESILGGEDYSNYKKELDHQEAIKKELDELRNMKSSEMTDVQIERMAELKAMKPNTEMMNTLKFAVDEKISSAVRGTRLSESYNERARKGQAFDADLNQYDAKQQEIVKKAIDSGILNNSNRTHQFVDIVAKISADKGVSFDFVNNAKLKESGFALDGKVVNGFVTKGGISINIDSPKAWQSTVGHEITHVLEGTELYTELQNSLLEYAETKGDLKGRRDALAALYDGVEGADVDAELTADLVGDYLFTDSDFINNLSTQHRNVFQKVYDEIKYLCKVVTAGSKEARQLEKVRHAFETAYRESGVASGETKYSLKIKHTDGTETEISDARDLTNEQAVDYLKQAKSGALRRDTYIPVRKDTPQVIIDSLEQVNETVSNQSLVMQVRKAQKAMAAENPGARGHGSNVRNHNLSPEAIVDIVSKLDDPTAIIYQTNRHDKNGKPLPNNVSVFVEYEADGNESVAVIEFESSINSENIGEEFGDTKFHTVVTVFEPDVERDGMPYDYAEELLSNPDNIEVQIEKRQSAGSATGEKHPNTSSKLPSFDGIIPQKENGVNRKFSISSDSDGKTLSKEQQDYFKDSKMRDENGNLKVMYHGSQDAGFHVFDPSMSDDDTSLFFVDRNDVAASYSGTYETYEAKAFKTADDANRFFAEIGKTDYEVVEENGVYTLLDGGDEVATSADLSEIYQEFCDYEGVGYGDANYKVYLNLTNPLEVDAGGRNWNNISREFSQEVYDRYKSLTDSEKTALAEIAGWDEYGIFKDEILSMARAKANGKYYDADLASAYEKLGGANANLYDAFSIAQDNFSEESLKEFAVKQMNTRDYARMAKEQGYDGVIFKNIHDNGGYSNGSEGASTVAIAFDSNQIKSVANEKPTGDADIRYSLSAEGEAQKRYGSFATPARDLRYEAPVQEDVAPVQDSVQDVAESDILPDDFAPPASEDIGPVAKKAAPIKEAYEAIRPPRQSAEPRMTAAEPRMKRADNKNTAPDGMEERSWYETSTGSEAVDGMVTPDDIPDDVRYYQVKSNKKTLDTANARLARDGYAKSREYFEGRMAERKLSVEDIALGERLIQEAAKAGDAQAVRDLIIDVSILGTELGQRVQALSIIRRLTPEGQLKALIRTVERGKAKGDKAFEGVEVTEDMTKRILDTKKSDGTFDQEELDGAVEDVKQQIADQMSVSIGDKITAWRYLSMLGNPKTHIRNIVSNVAMMGTRAVKNALARTIEDIAPVKNRTKTWEPATKAVKAFAKNTTAEQKSVIKGDNKYSDEGSIKAKRKIFGSKIVNGAMNFNTDSMEAEDWIFSRIAYRRTLQEYLTANGIKTEQDIKNNPELIVKAKEYALEEAKTATFRQDSYLANKIGEIERKNPLYGVAVGSIMPFKKTPINIAKTGAAYSPLGLARNIYDAVKLIKGEKDASEVIDHLAQTLTGTSLALLGYALAEIGFLNGAGDDDKEGKYDYQLGKQSYSFNFGGDTYSLSWLSPVAMPLFVGANAYETLVEKNEWDANVVIDTLGQTLDPMSEMSFLSSLDDVLSSYDSGIAKIWGAGESMVQNYATQFVPTALSQIASAFDDTKRSTRPSGDSGFEFGEETLNKIKYKIPGLRNTLEPTTDIWGNDAKQSENGLVRGFDSFLSPANKRAGIGTAVDDELKALYGEVGKSEILPAIPYDYINYGDTKYDMSAKDYTEYKQTYGQTAYDLMESLFETNTYRNATSDEKADMVADVYDYARDAAKKEYLGKQGVNYTNAEEEGVKVFKENPIKGAIAADLPVDEYTFSQKYPEKYNFFKANGITYDDYDAADENGKRAYTWAADNPEKYTLSKAVTDDLFEYRKYTSELYDLKADKDEDGKAISGSAKEKKRDYIFGLDLDYGQKIILYRSLYDSQEDKNTYNADIVHYLDSREDISLEEMITILEELGMKMENGYVTWD